MADKGFTAGRDVVLAKIFSLQSQLGYGIMDYAGTDTYYGLDG